MLCQLFILSFFVYFGVNFIIKTSALCYIPEVELILCGDIREVLGEPSPCSKSLNDIIDKGRKKRKKQDFNPYWVHHRLNFVRRVKAFILANSLVALVKKKV